MTVTVGTVTVGTVTVGTAGTVTGVGTATVSGSETGRGTVVETVVQVQEVELPWAHACLSGPRTVVYFR